MATIPSIPEKLVEIFNEDYKEPFSYALTFSQIKNTKEIFEKFSEIYKAGLVILYGNNNHLKIENLTYKNLETMHKYMLSFGVDVKYRKITAYEKTQYFKYFFDDLIKINGVNVHTTFDWKTQNIIKTDLKIESKNKEETFKKILGVMNNHLIISQIVNFFGLKKEKELHEHAIINNFKDETHMVSFKFADMGLYQKSVSFIVNHKIMM